MNQPPSQQQHKERRDYFRIEDTVLLHYISIDERSVQTNQIPTEFNEDQRFVLMRDLQTIDHENNKYLRSIAETNRDLEAYLKLLNKKIDILAGALANALNPLAEQQRQCVSISEGGLCLHTDTELALGSHIALQLTLLPSYVTLVLFAEIIDCSAIKDRFRIVMSFVHLKDGDRQQLAKHIMQLQLAAKRKHQLEKD